MKESLSKGMDLVVSFDTTGSMFPVLAKVRQEAVSFVNDMFDTISDIRVSVIAHGDYCDRDNPYTIRILDFTKDKGKICEFIQTTQRTYGGDADECYELVLNNARTTLSWEAGRLKVFVMIGDASPHGIDYPDNKENIDWINEAGLLNDLGVKIFAVHALSGYRSSSRNFYNTLALKTGGKYLTLDQFDEVVDLIKATCLAEYGEEQLNDFVSIIRSKGRLTRTMADNITRLGATGLLAYNKPVKKDGLIPVKAGRFQVMNVTDDCAIKAFVEENGITFKKGRGFYEVTKHETVQQYKEIIIQDRETGEMFTGAQVREKLGLSPQIEKGKIKESISSRSTNEFRVFIQSTSFNRKLIAGTAFLYEIDDIKDTGTIMKESAKEEEKKVVAGKKKTATKKKEVVKKTKAITVESAEAILAVDEAEAAVAALNAWAKAEIATGEVGEAILAVDEAEAAVAAVNVWVKEEIAATKKKKATKRKREIEEAFSESVDEVLEATKKGTKLPPLPTKIEEITVKPEETPKKVGKKAIIKSGSKEVVTETIKEVKVTARTLKKYSKEFNSEMEALISHADGKESAEEVQNNINKLLNTMEKIKKYINK